MVPLKLLQHSLLRPLDFPCQKWLHYSVLIHRWCYPTTAFAVLIYALRYIRVYSNAFSKIMVYCYWYKCHSINWKTNWDSLKLWQLKMLLHIIKPFVKVRVLLSLLWGILVFVAINKKFYTTWLKQSKFNDYVLFLFGNYLISNPGISLLWRHVS